MKNSEIITLYHGSKSGIQGAIAPASRARCDFGKGFSSKNSQIYKRIGDLGKSCDMIIGSIANDRIRV